MNGPTSIIENQGWLEILEIIEQHFNIYFQGSRDVYFSFGPVPYLQSPEAE